MASRDRMISLLPYCLKNGININKYYTTIGKLFDELIQVFVQIQQSRDIDQSELYGLDIIGDVLGESRNGLSDDDYRKVLRTKIISNRSDGSIETLNDFGRLLLGQFYEGIIASDNSMEFILQYTFPLVDNPTALMKKATAAGVHIKNELDTYVPVCGTYSLGQIPLTKVLAST